MRDYYEILSVRKRATTDEVKRAFRRLAQRYHPDKNPGDLAAEERFKELNEAYAVLSDPDKRREYDRFGQLARARETGFDGMGEALGDLFGELFSRPRRRRAGQKGPDLRYTLEVTFEEAALGTEKEIALPRLQTCARCEGQGAAPPSRPTPCPACGGTGEGRVQQGFFTLTRVCPDCSGVGRIIEDPCPQCRGTGKVPGERLLRVKVPAGVDTGQRLRLKGEGELGLGGGPPGDLYVQIRVAPHPLFVRDETDVVCEMPISFVQAALGATVEVPTLDGKVRMRIPAGTQSGKIFRLRQRGIPALRGYGRGDQLVRVVVETPSRLNDEQKRLLRRLAELGGEEIHPARKTFLEKMRDLFD
jgi:molecular chaperone DnaJ